MVTPVDFSGVIALVAPTAGVTFGTPVQIQGVWYLPEAGQVGSGTAAFGTTFSAQCLWNFATKAALGVTKAAGTGLGWTAGQMIYRDSSGNYTTTSTGNTLVGVALNDAAATDTTGNVAFGTPS